MSQESPPEKTRCHYFLDESGDGILFDKKGRVIIGTEGCSRFFILGLLQVDNPVSLTQEMDALRLKLLNDPYFQGVPSFDPRYKKTAVAFHAKDDIPEVRREVYSLLRGRKDLHFLAAIRDKFAVLDYVRGRNENDPAFRYRPDDLYDYMVRRLTRNLLHKHDEYYIYFAKRGRKDRTRALSDALMTARDRFDKKWNKKSNSTINVISARPHETAGLQAVDYFLWALQRLLVRREERYWEYVQPLCSLVIDIDDQRENDYGKYYTRREPLTLAALEERYGK